MRKILMMIFLSACLVFSVKSSFAQRTTARSGALRPTPQAKVDLGKLDGNTYTNDFFELKFDFPLGWLVGDNQLEAQLTKITQGSIRTTNPKNQRRINQAMNRLTPLLGGYKSLPGNPQNSNLRVAVENLSALPQIKTDKDYLNAMLLTFKSLPMPPGFQVSEIKSEMINNNSLNYVETSYAGSRRRGYAMTRKGYAVLITIQSFNDEDFDALHQVLTDADLSYKNDLK